MSVPRFKKESLFSPFTIPSGGEKKIFTARMKKHLPLGNKYAALAQPQATLDYHGRGVLPPDEICALARDFVENSFRQGLQRVLIITGKGLHSAEGPVIAPLLLRYLPTLPQVETVVTARRDRGGGGALEIRLTR